MLDPLELELQVVVSHPSGSGNEPGSLQEQPVLSLTELSPRPASDVVASL